MKESLAGKSAKCAKCGNQLQVPKPVEVEQPYEQTDLGNWLDDELSAEKSPATVKAKSKPREKSCSACGSPLNEGAVLCLACGFDKRSGKKHETRRVVEDEPAREGLNTKHASSLVKGVAFSAIGASLGAIVWVLVVVFTGYEIGWIAWGLGFAAGAGMAIGHEDEDGTTAGILAAGIAILGILVAKFFVFEHLKSMLAEAGISLELAELVAGKPMTFGSLFGPIDGLFILLAVASAYKIGSGQVTD